MFPISRVLGRELAARLGFQKRKAVEQALDRLFYVLLLRYASLAPGAPYVFDGRTSVEIEVSDDCFTFDAGYPSVMVRGFYGVMVRHKLASIQVGIELSGYPG